MRRRFCAHGRVFHLVQNVVAALEFCVGLQLVQLHELRLLLENLPLLFLMQIPLLHVLLLKMWYFIVEILPVNFNALVEATQPVVELRMF